MPSEGGSGEGGRPSMTRFVRRADVMICIALNFVWPSKFLHVCFVGSLTGGGCEGESGWKGEYKAA